MQLSNGKSPGLDDLSSELYKDFKDVLIPILKDLFLVIFQNELLSKSMKKGMIKIIYKRKGNKDDLRNYQPLSMLNMDYKILAKVFANRLKSNSVYSQASIRYIRKRHSGYGNEY